MSEVIPHLTGSINAVVKPTRSVVASVTVGPIASISDTGVVPGTYGSNTQITTITVDSKGRISTITLNNVATANETSNGFLTSTDWVTFNLKQKAITYGTSVPSGGANGDIYLQYT